MADDRPPQDADHEANHGLVPSGEDRSLKGAVVRLLHPIPLTVLLILVSVLLLVAANVLNVDNGRVLVRMANHEFARGLITYLFAVVTIGTAVVLVLAAFTGGLEEKSYERGRRFSRCSWGLRHHRRVLLPGQPTSAGLIRRTRVITSLTPLCWRDLAASGASAHLTAASSAARRHLVRDHRRETGRHDTTTRQARRVDRRRSSAGRPSRNRAAHHPGRQGCCRFRRDERCRGLGQTQAP